MRKLLSKPTVPFGYRREDEKSHDMAAVFGDKDPTILEASERFRFDHEMQRRQAFCRKPCFKAAMKQRITVSFFDRPFAYADAFISGTVELGAKRAASGNDRGPIDRIPNGLRSQQNLCMMWRVVQNALQPSLGGEIANSETVIRSVTFEVRDHCRKVLRTAYRRARNDTRTARRDIPDNRVPAVTKPVLDTGIYNLKTSRIPAVCEHQFADMSKYR